MDEIPTQYVYNLTDPKRADRSVSYYSRTKNAAANNVRVTDRRLVVNCAGRVDLPYTFKTHEPLGRRDYYLMYLLSGELDAIVCGENRRLVPGNVIIFPPEREYRYSKIGDKDIQYLWAHFTGYDAGRLLSDCGFSDCGVYHVGIDNALALTFMQLLDDFIVCDSYSEQSAAAKLTALIIAIRRKLDASDSGSTMSPGRVFDSLKFIHDNYHRALTNEQLAGIEHLSVSQYIELFKKITGQTPRSYLIELRLQSACDFLLRSDLTISQISQSIGYDDPHYFSRLFKARHGVSPERYREERISRSGERAEAVLSADTAEEPK